MRRPVLALSLALMAALAPLAPSVAVRAQGEPPKALEGSAGGGLNLTAVRAMLTKGDAAAASGNLAEARKQYDLARDISRRLLTSYRDISGAFRGLDARIPREMDQNALESLETLAKANLRLAAVFRRQNQPEVAIPLLVEVVKIMTPSREEGRKAYQSLIEIGFATIPYNGAVAVPGS